MPRLGLGSAGSKGLVQVGKKQWFRASVERPLMAKFETTEPQAG
jgi:hypothetical protein